MRLLIRVIMAASLITADAAQAASLTAAHGRREAENQVTNYEARLKNILDRDEKSWKRISASICAGCGSSPPPLEFARVTPAYVRAHSDAAAVTPSPEVTATASVTEPVSGRSAALKDHENGRPRLVRSDPNQARSKPNQVRLTVRARRHARYVRLRTIRHQRRLALLRAQHRQALLSLRARHQAHRVRLATLDFGRSEREEGRSGDDRRPVPLPPPRPDMLCADDRGLDTSVARSGCVSTQ